MSAAAEAYCIVACCRSCDGTTALCVDEPGHADENADSLADWYRRGDYLTRMPVKEARARGLCEGKCRGERPEGAANA